jgi:hypothetical protein
MADESSGAALVPRVERIVDFYGDPIPVALVNEVAFVPLRMMTDFLGLDLSAQTRRVRRDTVLARHVQAIKMTAADGKQYEMLCLELEYLPGWLFGISTSRVRPELEAKLERYREECFRVLWRAFQAEMVPGRAPERPVGQALEQVRALALAVATLAEQQLALEQTVAETSTQVGVAHTRLDRAAEVVRALHQRLNAVERQLTPATLIGEAQKAEISAAVKALAMLLTRPGAGSAYQTVFAEVYRRFGVSSYHNIRQADYEAVLVFLEDWRQQALSGALGQPADVVGDPPGESRAGLAPSEGGGADP